MKFVTDTAGNRSYRHWRIGPQLLSACPSTSSRGQSYTSAQTPYHNQRTLSTGAWIGSLQCRAMVSCSHCSVWLQHCWSHPCLCLDCNQAQAHAMICPMALLLSRMLSSLGAVSLISIKSYFHSAEIHQIENSHQEFIYYHYWNQSILQENRIKS